MILMARGSTVVLVLPIRVDLAHLVLHVQTTRVMAEDTVMMMSDRCFQMQLAALLMLCLSLLDLLW